LLVPSVSSPGTAGARLTMDSSLIDIIEVQAVLRDLGLHDPEILDVMNFVDVNDLVAAVFSGRTVLLATAARDYLDDQLAGSSSRASLARRLEGRGLSGGLGDALWVAETAHQRKQAALTRAAARAEDSAGTALSSAAAGTWCPRKRVRRADGYGEADRQLMMKWCRRLSDILSRDDVPSWTQAEKSADPAAAVAGLVGRARPTTVKKRVRSWECFARWLQWSKGRSWPAYTTDLVDYLLAQMAEGCPPSFPEAFRSAVLWVEARSGCINTFGRDEFFRKNIDRAIVLAQTGAEAVRKAPRFLVIMLGALECQVMCQGAPLGTRVISWTRLLKVYGTMRWDDLLRLRPRDVDLRAAGLSGRLSQTKTSGAGKKVRDLPLFIPREAYVLQEAWLETGHALWANLLPQGRDYFLPRFSADLRDYDKVPVSPRDVATLGKLVLESLTIPITDPEQPSLARWRMGTQPLIPAPLLCGWTGHSERSTLPSILAAMGVPKSERDPLGRWSPSGSDDYVRTYRALMICLAARFRQMILGGEILKAADEEDAVEDVRRFAAKYHAQEAVAEVREAAHRFFTTAKVFYGLLAMTSTVSLLPPVPLATVDPLDEKPEEEPAAKYHIVLSKKGAMLRLHKAGGCWGAQNLAFASYEVCNHDPVPQNLCSHFCHTCWPSGGP
jgi:hypothetical protein